MNRINYLVYSLSAILFFGCQAEKQAGSSVQESGRPNILFIVTDDQRADAMGCAGNQVIKTPNIDLLASSGVRFTNSYVMGGHHGAICAPSRAMLMSGKSLFQVYDNLDGVKTMPRYFAEQGFETFGTGKWHNSAKSFEASFQKGKNVMLEGMSNHFLVPCRNLSSDGKLTKPMNKAYSTDLFSEAVLEFLQEYSTGPRTSPFFCYLAFTAPHDPRSPREDYIGMYDTLDIPLPKNFKELHPFEFDDLNIRDETLAPWPRTPEIIKATLTDYYSMISHLDARIGDIIDLLKKVDLYNNTLIVFVSDNGLAAGSHGLLGKQNLYEHSIKVPLIIAGPGVPHGVQLDALVYLYDLFPTLASLTGLPEPVNIDGINLHPVIQHKEKGVRSSLYTAYRNTVRSVRTNDWKLIWYLQRNHIQLFNLQKDPDENINLAGSPNNKDDVLEMMNLLKEWYKASGDTATLYPTNSLPMNYDYTKLRQTPDKHQPKYVIDRFFPDQKQ